MKGKARRRRARRGRGVRGVEVTRDDRRRRQRAARLAARNCPALFSLSQQSLESHNHALAHRDRRSAVRRRCKEAVVGNTLPQHRPPAASNLLFLCHPAIWHLSLSLSLPLKERVWDASISRERASRISNSRIDPSLSISPSLDIDQHITQYS